MKKQTLKQRAIKSNTPTDASQVRSNCGLSLNRDESLSVASSKTCFNNPEVNQLQSRAGGLKVNVPVLSLRGKPLMPCSPAKARKLLKQGKAKVVKRIPFIIKLNFACENKTQRITFGLDCGYANIGFSAITSKKELISGSVCIDNKTSERITDKSMYRRNRRRRLRYRQRRYLNRKSSKKQIPPSVQRRIDTHIQLVRRWAKWIPITKVNIEIANFDIQKIINQNIKGKQYAQGNLYGYENLKAYIIAREYSKCQLCKNGMDKQGWHLHHIIERANGGTNRSDNIALLHKRCHKKLHTKGLKLKPNSQFKAETFMSIAKWRIVNKLKLKFTTKTTFGYETKIRRNELELDKSHINDAFVIANGGNQNRCLPIIITQKHINNRSLGLQKNGFPLASRRCRYKIQPNDLIWVDGKKETAKGCFKYGEWVVLKNDLSKKRKSVSINRIDKVYNFGSFIYSN